MIYLYGSLGKATDTRKHCFDGCEGESV